MHLPRLVRSLQEQTEWQPLLLGPPAEEGTERASHVAKKESSIYKAVAIPGEQLTPHLPHVVVTSLRYFCAETFKDCLEGWSASKARVHINTTHGVDDGGPWFCPINNCAPRSQRALRRRCRRRQESHLQNRIIRTNRLLRPKQANHHQPPPKSGEITQNFSSLFPGSSAIKTLPYIGLRSALRARWLCGATPNAYFSQRKHDLSPPPSTYRRTTTIVRDIIDSSVTAAGKKSKVNKQATPLWQK